MLRSLTTLLVVSFLLLLAPGTFADNHSDKPDLVDSLSNSIQNLSTCASCQTLLVSLTAVAHLGDDKFVLALLNFCSALGIQEPKVCRGVMGAQGPIIAHSLRSMKPNGQTSTLFCVKTFGVCDDPPVREWKTIPLPPKHTRKPQSPSPNASPNQKPLQVIHLSDLHIDREYTVGADAVCARSMCCRADQPPNASNKIISPAGPYGSHTCDSPPALYVSMLKALPSHAPDAAFVVHTGDMVEHAVWNSVRKQVEDRVTEGHSQYGSYSQTPFYGIIGNHDVAPTNAFPRNTTITTKSAQWDFDLFSENWKRWIGENSAQTVKTVSGCYSLIHPGTNLKIISLNTGYWYKANFWLYDSDEFQPDPNGIFAWLINELQDAEEKGQKAWITGHISPGKTDTLREPSRYLNQIIRRYKDTIAALLYGHTHRSEWEIVYEDPAHPTADTAVAMNFIGPAMTPESGNPAFRVYDVDPVTYEILDFHEIIANLTEPGYQSQPRWYEYYSARQLYGNLLRDHGQPCLNDDQSPLDGAFWHRVTNVLEQSRAEFDKFYHRLIRGADLPSWKPCYSEGCRKKYIQALRSSQSEFNGDSKQTDLSFGSTGKGLSRRSQQIAWKLEPDENDGEHTCGDLASLYKHAKHMLGELPNQQVKISEELRNLIRQSLYDS